MAVPCVNFLTRTGSVRIRFDNGVSVEAKGRYFTLDIEAPLAVSVSDGHLLFILDKEGDNLAAYTMAGEFAFSLADFGIDESLIAGSVMTAAEVAISLSRYPDAPALDDHIYYLATTKDYRMLWFDLNTGSLIYQR